MGQSILGQGWSDPGAQLFVAPVGQHETGGRGRKKKERRRKKDEKKDRSLHLPWRGRTRPIRSRRNSRQREGDKQDSSLGLSDVSVEIVIHGPSRFRDVSSRIDDTTIVKNLPLRFVVLPVHEIGQRRSYSIIRYETPSMIPFISFKE